MKASRQEISETLESAVELLIAVRLSQGACQRLQNLAHGEGYFEAHDICAHLHEVRQEAERLQRSLDDALEQAETLAGNLAPDLKPGQIGAHHNRRASHYTYNTH